MMEQHVFHILRGYWKLYKEVIFFSGEMVARYDGVARYTNRETEVLLYREEGMLQMASGANMRAFQGYYFVMEKHLNVYFDEEKKRLFHTFSFLDSKEFPLRAKGEHYCKCDHYSVEYLFHHSDHYEVVYSVTGPKKNYRIFCTAMRA